MVCYTHCICSQLVAFMNNYIICYTHKVMLKILIGSKNFFHQKVLHPKYGSPQYKH